MDIDRQIFSLIDKKCELLKNGQNKKKLTYQFLKNMGIIDVKYTDENIQKNTGYSQVDLFQKFLWDQVLMKLSQTQKKNLEKLIFLSLYQVEKIRKKAL